MDIEWRYPAHELEPIDDCYALNLDGEVAWAHTYSSFSVARVENSQVRLWPTQVDGANALVVGEDRVALIGGYGANHDRLVLGQLGDAFTEVRTARVAMPDGSKLPSRAICVGRADELHVFIGSEWFRMTLDDMA